MFRSFGLQPSFLASFAAIVVGVTLFSAGCSSAGDDSDDVSVDALSGESSNVSNAVLSVLSTRSPGMKGVTWNVSHDNTFDADWLINTPSQKLWGEPLATLSYPAVCKTNCDPDFAQQLCRTQADCAGRRHMQAGARVGQGAGPAPTSMCVGHSADLVDRTYALIANAQSFVDIASLSPADGQYRAAIRNAITYLSAKPNPPVVRIMTAEMPFVFRGQHEDRDGGLHARRAELIEHQGVGRRVPLQRFGLFQPREDHRGRRQDGHRRRPQHVGQAVPVVLAR